MQGRSRCSRRFPCLVEDALPAGLVDGRAEPAAGRTLDRHQTRRRLHHRECRLRADRARGDAHASAGHVHLRLGQRPSDRGRDLVGGRRRRVGDVACPEPHGRRRHPVHRNREHHPGPQRERSGLGADQHRRRAARACRFRVRRNQTQREGRVVGPRPRAGPLGDRHQIPPRRLIRSCDMVGELRDLGEPSGVLARQDAKSRDGSDDAIETRGRFDLVAQERYRHVADEIPADPRRQLRQEARVDVVDVVQRAQSVGAAAQRVERDAEQIGEAPELMTEDSGGRARCPHLASPAGRSHRAAGEIAGSAS